MGTTEEDGAAGEERVAEESVTTEVATTRKGAGEGPGTTGTRGEVGGVEEGTSPGEEDATTTGGTIEGTTEGTIATPTTGIATTRGTTGATRGMVTLEKSPPRTAARMRRYRWTSTRPHQLPQRQPRPAPTRLSSHPLPPTTSPSLLPTLLLLRLLPAKHPRLLSPKPLLPLHHPTTLLSLRAIPYHLLPPTCRLLLLQWRCHPLLHLHPRSAREPLRRRRD